MDTDFDKPFRKDKYFELKFGSGDLRMIKLALKMSLKWYPII